MSLGVLVEKAMATQVEPSELPVAVVQTRQRDRSCRAGGRAAYLSYAILEAVREIDASAMLGPGHRVPYRLTSCFDIPGTRNLPRRASTSTSYSMGWKSGSSLVGDIAE